MAELRSGTAAAVARPIGRAARDARPSRRVREGPVGIAARLERMLEIMKNTMISHGKLIGLPRVKFLRAAVAGECLLLGVEFISTTQGRCICRGNAQTVAQCSFTLTTTHPDAA